MEYLGGLLITIRGNDYLIVEVNNFSKMIFMIPHMKTISLKQEN
jgi:hypothetical protein